MNHDILLPKGFQVAGVHCGIKPSGLPDLALFSSDLPATVAGVFTRNQVAAAPVHLSRERVAGGEGQAVVINSGNANCCTGAQGHADALEMGKLTADALGIDESLVSVCSTGHIGKPLDMAPVRKGIALAAEALSSTSAAQVAEAIMTTDTVPKALTTELTIDGKTARISGFCKGAGMIEPNMGTMLGVILCDLSIAAPALREAHTQAVDASFNRISVDGDTSTNDTVLLYANGASGISIEPGSDAFDQFQSALDALCLQLSHMIVRDGEGATRFLTLTVSGAKHDADADAVARTVANSLLVKTGWAGGDPVWGRILGAIGRAPALVDESKIRISCDGVVLVESGVEALTETRSQAMGSDVAIDIDLGLGNGQAVIYTNDLTEEYVAINLAEYVEDEEAP